MQFSTILKFLLSDKLFKILTYTVEKRTVKVAGKNDWYVSVNIFQKFYNLYYLFEYKTTFFIKLSKTHGSIILNAYKIYNNFK